MIKFISQYLSTFVGNVDTIDVLSRFIAITGVIIICAIADFIAKRIILKNLNFLIGVTETKWDDTFVERKVFDKLSHLAPVFVIYLMTPFALEGYDNLIGFITKAALALTIVIGILVVDSILNAVNDIYLTFEVSREVPIKGFIQIVKIVIYFICIVFMISIIVDKSPIYLLSGVGALTAVLILIFKDVILGFVAGIQITANKMLARGDWIEMPKYGADGDVLDVALTTVKIQNWDKTITSIPTSAFINEWFKNWTGMQRSGGRRIKRSIYIDINSIKFCSDEMLKEFLKIQYISEYIDEKKKEIAAYNSDTNSDDSSVVNGRRLTNIGVLRAYIKVYLEKHTKINQNMTFLIRQLAPTEHGLPLEIYVFCKDTVWVNYEAIQSDIFDHIFAIVPEFHLKIFQTMQGVVPLVK